MTGCEIIKCSDFKDGKCNNELDYVSKIDGSPMCPKNDNAIPREEDSCKPSDLSDLLADNMIECFNCGRTVYLTMFAHRKNKKIVGWVFLCTACARIMAGKEMEFIVR